MLASTLKSLITIRRPADGEDEIGQPVPDWVDLATVWANIRHLSGVEAVKADVQTSAVKASIRIRWRTDVTAAMRVVRGATTYEIKAVLPDEAQRRHVDLVCEVLS